VRRAGAGIIDYETRHLCPCTTCCIGDRFGVKLGDDEPIAAHLWRRPSLVLVGVLAVPFLVIISLVMLEGSWPQSCTRARFWLHHAVAIIGTLIGNVLDPWLFPRR
jgi:hypothetical protein